MLKKTKLALGLMSGTSADGVSLALIRIDGNRGGLRRPMTIAAYGTYSYSKMMQSRILNASGAQAAELCRLHFDLGRIFAQAARRFLKRHRVHPKRLAVVGSHGQTVVHLPESSPRSTLQIGEPSFLAEMLGVPIVSDFRPRDIAAGGQGAPLVPFLDQYLFGDGPARALQNIGGIANVTLVGRGVRPVAFDTGPGNCLMDAAMRRVTGGRLEYDRNGAMARRGKVDLRKARALLQLPYFHRRPPKSLDRGAFAGIFLEKYFARELRRRPADAMATLAYFTAATIADQYRRFLCPSPYPLPSGEREAQSFPRLFGERMQVRGNIKLSEVVVSGGGTLNSVLMGHLKILLAPVPVRSIADYGIHPLAKEPAAFALMAYEALRGRVNHLPQATGARGPRILGKITPA